jgi:hypothetical protein
MSASYYALIRRHDNGRLSAWVPDIPDVTASGSIEEEVIRELTRSARRHLQEADNKGVPRPVARRLDQLMTNEVEDHHRCVLLVLTVDNTRQP